MKKYIVLAAMVCAVCACTVFAEEPELAKTGVVAMEEDEIKRTVVRIRGYEGVSPLNLFVKPGTVVIWLNQYRGNVMITFPHKKVSLACKSPVNFSLSDAGFFVSQAIGHGAVASLCFMERGTYDYFIEREPGLESAKTEGFRFEGKIVVK